MLQNIQSIKIPSHISLLLTRLILAAIFIFAGWFKVSNMAMTLGMFAQLGIPAYLTYIVSYGEIIGGIALLVGFLGELAAICLGIIMIVAIVLMREGGVPAIGFPLATLAALIAIAGNGTGIFSVTKKQ